MKNRTTWILIGLFGIALAYAYWVQLPKPQDTPAPRPAPRVFELPPGQVARLELRNLRTAQQIQLTRVDNAWQIEKPTQRAVDTPRVNEIADGFAQMQANRVLTDVTDLRPYGVLTGTLEARMIMRDSTAYAIIIGNKVPQGDSYYAIKTGDTKTVFIIGPRLPEEWLTWFDNPPYPPTPTPTFTPVPTRTPAPTETPSPGATPTR